MARIALDCTAALFQQAGIGRYTRELFRALLSEPSQHEMVLFHCGRADGQAPIGSDSVRRANLPLSPRAATIMWYRLRLPIPAEMFVGRVDCFHSPDYMLPPLFGARGVVTIHDLSFLVHPELADPRLRSFLERVVPGSARRAALVLADSEHTKADVVRLLGVAERKVEVIYSGVTPPFGLQSSPSLEAISGIDRQRPFILTVGTVEPRKNLTRLFEAYARLRLYGKLPHQLVVVGRRGWLYENTLRRIGELGLQDHIKLLEDIADVQLANLYSLCDVFVYPSMYEGFGLPPLEALACGAPTIVSNVSSLPEVVGESAVKVDPLDVKGIALAMQHVIEDRQLRERLAVAGPLRAQRFSWQREASRLAELYDRVLAG